MTMPTLDESLRRRLIAKFGTTVNLESQSAVVSEMLHELATELRLPSGGLGGVDSYDKTYSEGYNKEDYSRGRYSRYDRTDGGIYEDIYDDLITAIRPELDKLVVARLRDRAASAATDAAKPATPTTPTTPAVKTPTTPTAKTPPPRVPRPRPRRRRPRRRGPRRRARWPARRPARRRASRPRAGSRRTPLPCSGYPSSTTCC
jgi:hypothetical protein